MAKRALIEGAGNVGAEIADKGIQRAVGGNRQDLSAQDLILAGTLGLGFGSVFGGIDLRNYRQAQTAAAKAQEAAEVADLQRSRGEQERIIQEAREREEQSKAQSQDFIRDLERRADEFIQSLPTYETAPQQKAAAEQQAASGNVGDDGNRPDGQFGNVGDDGMYLPRSFTFCSGTLFTLFPHKNTKCELTPRG